MDKHKCFKLRKNVSKSINFKKNFVKMSQIYQQQNNTIQEFLNSKNIYPIKNYNSYGMYLSPIREENTPSFKVDYIKDLFFDFGLNKGGNLKTLKEILGVEIIKNEMPFIKQIPKKIMTLKNQIWSIEKLTNKILKKYLNERKILPEIYNEYCLEVHYGYYQNYPKKGIGFKNNMGGFEIRSKSYKGCLGIKNISTFYNKEINRVALFEGFMDFLSFKTIYPLNSHNYVILNSTTQTQKAIDFLKSHAVIYTFLDNDKQGDITTNFIKGNTISNVCDMRKLYTQFKDLNEYLVMTKSNELDLIKDSKN